jgi:hypothetical protein
VRVARLAPSQQEAPMRERQMLDFIEAECRVRGILSHHCLKGYNCEGTNGLADLILVGSHKLAFWELKGTDLEKLSSSQKTWDYKLRCCGYSVRLITPCEMSRVPDYLDSLNNP